MARGRTEAAALGLAIGTYVDRLLDAREHPEQAVRACCAARRRDAWVHAGCGHLHD